MDEQALAAVILQELVSAGYMSSYMAYSASMAAAKQIKIRLDKLAAAKARKPGPPPHYPPISCECGAERIASSRHATWCPVVTGERKRR